MRPDIFQQRGMIVPETLIPGLFQSRGAEYNNRHILPIAKRPVQDNDGRNLPYEAAMKPKSQPRSPSVPPVPVSKENEEVVETRAQRLARIKREIDAGTYETPEKLDAAIERMLGAW